MNQYKITGKYRQIGAIGIFENFERSIKAFSIEEAKEGVRRLLYSEGFEHVLCESCEYDRTNTAPMYFDTSKIRDTGDLKDAAKEAGSHFFDRDTMRFFRSRLAPGLAQHESQDAVIFITSEQYVHYDPYRLEDRMYTIRMFTQEGRIDTIGDFQEYDTLRDARKAVKEYAED